MTRGMAVRRFDRLAPRPRTEHKRSHVHWSVNGRIVPPSLPSSQQVMYVCLPGAWISDTTANAKKSPPCLGAPASDDFRLPKGGFSLELGCLLAYRRDHAWSLDMEGGGGGGLELASTDVSNSGGSTAHAVLCRAASLCEHTSDGKIDFGCCCSLA